MDAKQVAKFGVGVTSVGCMLLWLPFAALLVLIACAIFWGMITGLT